MNFRSLCFALTLAAFAPQATGQNLAESYEWVNNRPKSGTSQYIKSRRGIEGIDAGKGNGNAPARYQKYLAAKKAWEADRKNQAKLYSYAYSWYLSRITHRIEPTHPGVDIIEALNAIAIPKDYEVWRVKALVHITALPHPKLLSAAEQLDLIESDRYTRNSIFRAYRFLGNTTHSNRLIQIATAEMQRTDSTPGWTKALGEAYWHRWAFKKDRADMEKAISLLQQYLKIADPSDPLVKQAKSELVSLQRAKAMGK